MGDGLMVFLLCIYALTCMAFLWEGNYPKALYWAAAFLITTSVLWMKT